MPTREQIMGELAEQGLGNFDPYGGAVAAPPGALADQTAYDPWERAAAAVRFGAKPLGGRQEGAATTLPENLLFAAPRAAAGFTKAAFDRAAEEHGGVPQQSTDYDPRRMGALLGAETAMNVVGLPALTGGVPAGAVGSAARDPNLWHDISRVRLPKPVSEMQATHVPTQAVKEKVITPAEMEGGWLLPAVGDRSITGTRLTGYNGFPFSTPVEMQGGHGFMAAQADKGLAWASNPGVITRIANKVKTLGAKGDPVYFPYTAMHPEGADFSHHVSDTLSEALKHVPLSRNAQREFNRTMKADHVDFGPVKNWPGVMSDNLREYLINAPGDVRNKFAKVMDTRKFQDVGFPSVAEARHAVTDPRLLDAPRGSAGLSISKMDPTGKAVPGASGHRTYSTDIAGNYIGGLARMIPRDVFYPDIVKGYEKLGSDPNLFMALGRTGAPIAQKATPKWVDSVSKWMEQNPRAGMKYSNFTDRKTGAVLGGLAATDEYRPPFYSAVERAVQGAKQNTAPGQQWAGYLRNQPGVKPEEIEALKLGQLFEQPSALPKQSVLDQIAANRVNVGEVVKGGGPPHQFGTPEQQTAARDRLETARIAMIDTRRQVGTPEWVAAGEEHRAAEAAMRDIVPGWGRAPDAAVNPTRHSQWVMPGGENYREMLLTLPTGDTAKAARMSAIEKELQSPGITNFDPASRTALREEYKRLADETRSDPMFKSSHYDEPNILAHVRYNDRVINGKKTLFVEEVQSDWHQAGREKGYVGSKREPTDAEVKEFFQLREGANPADYRQEMMEHPSFKSGAVPDAPFKTTWPELAMKRIIREAAEKGYDKVAWTPGSVQAARYPEQLRQHVDNISWDSPGAGGRSNPEGLRYVHAKPRAGGMDLVFTVNKDGMITEASASQAKGQHVEDIFGKDMSRQIMDKAEGEIASKDFVIGAKGMEGFYDEILPATVNKLVKKHGGRVQQGQIDVSGGKPLDSRYHAENEGVERVHTIDITPSLREQAMKGFPLFTAGGVAATGAMGELARQDEYQR